MEQKVAQNASRQVVMNMLVEKVSVAVPISVVVEVAEKALDRISRHIAHSSLVETYESLADMITLEQLADALILTFQQVVSNHCLLVLVTRALAPLLILTGCPAKVP